MNNEVKILKVNKVLEGIEINNAIWYDYQVYKAGKYVSSFIKVDKSIQTQEINLLIEQEVCKIGIDNFIPVSQLSPYIIKKIHEILLLESELFFINEKEIQSLSREEKMSICDDIEKYKLHEVLHLTENNQLLISKNILKRCHFDNENIILINIQDKGPTELEFNSSIYSYVALKGNETLCSYLILNNENTIEETTNKIMNHIKEKGFYGFIKLNSLNDYLGDMIIECVNSEKEMYFVDYDDKLYNQLDLFTKKSCMEEVEQYHLKNYIEFNTVDAAMTIDGKILEVINFKS